MSTQNLEITIRLVEGAPAMIYELEAPVVPSYWIVEAKDCFMLLLALLLHFRYNVFYSENMILNI